MFDCLDAWPVRLFTHLISNQEWAVVPNLGMCDECGFITRIWASSNFEETLNIRPVGILVSSGRVHYDDESRTRTYRRVSS